MTVTRHVWGQVWKQIERRDHRVMRRLNRWRAPRWIRYWMIAATRLGDGWLWYSLAAVLPFLAAKQRDTHPHDWMASDAEIACPDPNCPSRLRITRMARRRFSHAETTAVPLGARPAR